MARRYLEPGLADEGRTIVHRLGGRWTAGGGMCRCPAHDDRTPSLSVRVGRSRLLFRCFAGCDATSVLRRLRADGLLGRGRGAAADPGPQRAAVQLPPSVALRLWGGARPVAGTPADHYLARRGLQCSSPELRFGPRTPHGPSPFTQFRPALIAAVRDASGLVAVHRTFLERTHDGRDWRAGAKCALAPLGRGAVRLGGTAARIGLAEGVESALSAMALFQLPCWATLGTERFRHVCLPPQVEELVLFLDHDAGGRRAEALARQSFGYMRRIEARYPPRPGDDWNDVLRAAVGAPSFS
ncbi:MAG TPA: toprim domain-containing protein [Sphingomonadaceae bacterium]|nr:toprim domain-containing protein [Sphingomonadaceae bacterium]